MIERDYYSLKDTAELLGCTIDDLYDLDEDDQICLAVCPPDGCYFWRHTQGGGEEPPVLANGFAIELSFDEAGDIRRAGEIKINYTESGYLSSGPKFKYGKVTVTVDNLVVTKSDFKKLSEPCEDRLVSDSARHTPETNHKDLTETERGKLLKQIGLMALVLAEKSNKFKRGETPNALQIANAVQEILDAGDFKGKKGTGSTEIRDSISMGLKLLQSED